MKVLVTCAHSRMAYAAVCSLGSRGVEVYTADCTPCPMSSYSRYAAGHDRYPSPYREPEAFMAALAEIAQRRGIDLLMPIYDETLVIARHRDRLPAGLNVAAEGWEKLARVHDKFSLMQLASTLNVRVPQTFMASEGLSIEDIAGQVRYPVVLKPVRGAGAFGVSYAGSPDELLRLYRAFDRERHRNELMVQEFIDGDVCCQALLCQRGEVRASFAYRQLREFPVKGGTATWRESIRLPEMEEALGKILRELDWTGVCQADFIVSRATGAPYLTDCNPRFWGSLKQAVASGVDFPWLLYLMATGQPLPIVPDYRLGVRTLWIWGDVRVLLARLANGGGKLAALGGFLTSLWRADRFDDFNLRDPLPFLVYPAAVAAEVWRSRSLRPSRGGV